MGIGLFPCVLHKPSCLSDLSGPDPPGVGGVVAVDQHPPPASEQHLDNFRLRKKLPSPRGNVPSRSFCFDSFIVRKSRYTLMNKLKVVVVSFFFPFRLVNSIVLFLDLRVVQWQN